MSLLRIVSAVALAANLLMPGVLRAQTANGSPTAPAPGGLVGTPRPVSRTAPGVGPRHTNSAAALPSKPVAPKLTAADRAEQRKLEHDLQICIGC